MVVMLVLPLSAVALENSDTEKKSSVDQEQAVSKIYTVTSIQKCYESLGKEDALDIQKNYLKPYQECQRRLMLKLQSKQEAKPGEAKEDSPDKTHNFYKVQKDRGHPPEEEHKTPEKPKVFEGRIVPLN